jgi:hypothetical protein
MIPGRIEHIEINNNGTITIDGILYNNQEEVVAIFPEFSGGTLLDFIFDCEINCGGNNE